MNKIGVSLKIDLSKVDMNRIFNGQNGAQYLDMTIFIDPNNPGQYGDHGFITQNCSKEEKQQGVQMPILGNGKIFWVLEPQGAAAFQVQAPQQQAPRTQQAPPPPPMPPSHQQNAGQDFNPESVYPNASINRGSNQQQAPIQQAPPRVNQHPTPQQMAQQTAQGYQQQAAQIPQYGAIDEYIPF